MITYFFRTIKDDSLKEVSDLRTGVWIHVVAPTEEELTDLFKKLALDEALIEDAQDFFEVPRFERSDGATFFFTRYPFTEKRQDTDTAPLLIVMGESFVLTVVQREIPQFKAFFNGTEVIHTTQKTKLFIQIMQQVTSSYEKQLVLLRRNVNRDRAQLRRIGNREIERFVTFEHKLNDMISAIVPTNTALQQITKGNHIQLFSDDVELMEDLIIDNTQLVDSARSVLKTIQNVRSATEAILANNLNTTIKTLTVLTILLTIPTIVASLFGMNVPLPLQDTPHAFWAVCGIIVTSVGLVVWYFRKNEWL
ncbi:MAG TPA: magnesium transporter CorA family protein [Candidatus Paceibacterota bacterium]